MKDYWYYQEVLCVVWERKHFVVTAENQDEADQLAGQCTDDSLNHDSEEERICILQEDETIYDTMEPMPLEENHGKPTIEVYRKDRTFIANNLKKR